MTYKEELRQMNNEELLSDLRYNIENKLHRKRREVQAELLFRLNRDPMSENCGNCRYAFGSLCINAESWLNGATVDCSIRCSFWKGGER